jgi:hypothetical protein
MPHRNEKLPRNRISSDKDFVLKDFAASFAYNLYARRIIRIIDTIQRM